MEPNEIEMTSEGPDNIAPTPPPQPEKRTTLKWLLAVCIAVAASVLLTYTLTAESKRREYTARLLEQQKVIDLLGGSGNAEAENLLLLNRYIRQFSYYANSLNEQEMLEAAFKAYVNASGDAYAQYYTEAEYLSLLEANSGNRYGIGVTIVRETITVNEAEYLVFRIKEIYAGAPAESAGLCLEDMIYAVEKDGSMETVASLGFDGAVNAIQGEEGTSVKLKVFRETEGEYQSVDYTVFRQRYESLSVRGSLFEGDATVGVVKISGFDMTTPHQFKEAVNSLRESGAVHFVFDVRGNPGGDLRSISAVLSYFLREGDTILSAIDKNGTVATTYKAEPITLEGDYAGCSVTQEEIGMYADLDMVVLCDEHTASAAEVLTATMRDYGLAKTVGKTTFGKGIMQSTLRIPFRNIVGYVKMTTYAYVTKCGVSYHGIGITPDVGVELSEEAKKYPITLLPHDMDEQLKTAVAQFYNNT